MTPFVFVAALRESKQLTEMDGYSEIGAIYFSVGDTTSVAKYVDNRIVTKTFEGPPPYQTIKGKIPLLLKQYHAAEHQVYNCFMKKIKRVKRDAKLSDLASYVPTMEEVEKTKPFSIFCGTTIFLCSGVLLVFSALPNLLKFNNHNLLFMLLWMPGTMLLALLVGMWVQYKFFLAKPKRYQLRLAIEALKEVFKDGTVTC